MSNRIERLRFYEREYLQSFDFVAEQTYHLEMRRRLNMALHLWGIVDGLEILPDTSISGVPAQFFISPGMAIDAYGREIVLFTPHALTDDDLTANHIAGTGHYSVWIAYSRKPSTPPAPGYRLCDLKDQYTRWREGYRVLLLANDPTLPPEPGVVTDLPDDPGAAPWPVKLGSIVINRVNGQLIVANAVGEQRTYIGLRAQRIITPGVTPPVPPPTPPDPVLDKISTLDAPLSLGVEATVFAEKNLIVGGNFRVDKSKIKPSPPGTFPSPTGNLKVANDLFLQGNLYANVAGEWLGIKNYVQSCIPDIQISTKDIPVAPTSGNPNPSTDTTTISVTTKLPTVSDAQMVVAISKIKWLRLQNAGTWETAINGDAVARTIPLQIQTEVLGHTNVNKQYDFTIRWTIGPTAPNPPRLHVAELTVSYIAVFLP